MIDVAESAVESAVVAALVLVLEFSSLVVLAWASVGETDVMGAVVER